MTIVDRSRYVRGPDLVSLSGLREDSEVYLLDDSATVHLKRKCQDVTLHGICQYLLLRLITMFEKLLDHIIAEHVRHQLN